MATVHAVVLVMIITGCEDPAAPIVDAGRLIEPMFSMSGIPEGPLIFACWTGGQEGDTAFFRVTADGGTLLTEELEPSPDPNEVTIALPHVPGYQGQCAVPWVQGSAPFDPDPTTVTVTQIGATGLETDSIKVDQPATSGTTFQTPPDTVVTLSMTASNPVAAAFYYNAMAQQDTSRPAIPDTIPLPERDTTTLFRDPADTTVLIYPDILEIAFDDSTSGLTVQTILGQTGDIIGGQDGTVPLYFVQIPTPASSLTELDSLRAAIAAIPGVALVIRGYYRIHVRLRGRYPSDGVLLNRASWFTPTRASRPLLAIGAPLAWGCETGVYSQSRIRLGVMDVVFDRFHNDLAGSSITVITPPAASLAPSPSLALLTSPDVRNHGTGVVGTLAATGDNGIGSVGMVWGADLRLFSFSTGVAARGQLVDGRWATDHVRQAGDFFRQAAHDKVRVLNLSFGVGLSHDSSHVEYLRQNAKTFLDSAGYLVVSAGQEATPVRMSLSTLKTTTDARMTALDKALALLHDTYPDRIFYVAGTDSTGALWAQSNYITGLVDVAAPVDLWNLALDADTATYQGTSFSTPLVAGAVAQLLLMDSTLTAADVKRFIREGAQVQRRSPSTGALVNPPPVAGAPETVYQLDAYGALTLLSNERPVTPVCGHAVSVDGGTSVVLEKSTAGNDTISLSGANELFGVSVAQGGRLIAVHDFDADADVSRTIVVDHKGAQVTTTPSDVFRYFLEEDTLDVTRPFDGQSPVVYRMFPGTSQTAAGFEHEDLLASVVPSGYTIGDAISYFDISPDGSTAAFTIYTFPVTGCGSGVDTYIWGTVPLSGGSPTVVGSWNDAICPNLPCISGTCEGPADIPVWSHDSRRAIFVRNIGQITGQGVVPGPSELINVAGGSTTTSIVNRFLSVAPLFPAPRFSADDIVLMVGESTEQANSCERVTRLATNLGTVVGSPVASERDCALNNSIVITNSPALIAMPSWATPFISRTEMRRRPLSRFSSSRAQAN